VTERVGVASHLVHAIARLRVGLGFACGIAVFWLAAPTRTTIFAGLPVAIAGELVRLWAAGHLNKSREVTRSGPYVLVAHPLYLGSSIIGAGLAIGSGSLVVGAIVVVYLAVTLSAAIRSEEAFLHRVFGDDYIQYRHRGQVDRGRRFSWARAMANREWRAIAGVAAALLLLIFKATYNGLF
jgi:protein-S-isoprenylcysteine O-methyltransferase Ste14